MYSFTARVSLSIVSFLTAGMSSKFEMPPESPDEMLRHPRYGISLLANH